MKGRAQSPVDATANLAPGTKEIAVPSSPVSEHGKTAEIMRIDQANGHANVRHKGSGPATGPRTELGKQQSRHNAVRHGIFSQAILLKAESRSEFELLRTGLYEALQPAGKLEELLVDKLASLSWRYRRLLVAETGEIRNRFLEWDRQRDQQIDRTANSLADEDSLIAHIEGPEILKRCLELLVELREGIKMTGFQEQRDTSTLKKLYGSSEYSRDRLPNDYSAWLDTAQCSEEERVRERYATPDECAQNVLDSIDHEIRRLKALHKRRINLQSQQNEIELARRSVPESEWLDRVLRYEASLERGFERTLSQLERLQRMRLGQPVAPRVDVTISGEIST